MMMNRLIAITCAACAVLGCEGNPLDPESTDLVVVEAFLFAGEPIDDIRITATLPLGSDDTTEAPPINDADVRLIKNGTTYLLSPVSEDGRYYYADTDLEVATGDLFRIEVSYFGRLAFGETVVPERPVGVQIDGDTLYAPEIGRGQRPGQGDRGQTNTQLATTWDNPNGQLHFVVVEGLDDSAETILPQQFQERFSRFQLISRPTADDFYFIRLAMLRNLGRHLVTVYRVNQEYAELYENRTQDSRDLNEPPSNIENGLGVFSAFNSSRVFFQVVREQD